MVTKSTRIGIVNYVLGNTTAIAAWSVFTVSLIELLVIKGQMSLQTLTFSVSVTATLVGAVFYSLSVKRFRDLNLSGWLVKLLALPIPGLLLIPYLCFVPGSSGSNAYGEPPPSPGIGRILITLLMTFLAFNFFAGAWSTYHRAMAV